MIEQPYSGSYLSQYWYTSAFTRSLGLVDHPLVLASVLAAAIAVAPTVHPAVARAPLVLTLLTGIVLTASRTGTGLAAVALAFLMLRKDTPRKERLVMGTAVAAGAVTFGGLLISAGLSDRLSYDNGSSAVRWVAARYVLTHFDDYFLTGLGSGNSRIVATDAGLSTSLESPLWIYTVEFSGLFTLLYFGAIVHLLVRGGTRDGAGNATRIAAALFLISAVSFSSLATRSCSGGILWFLIGVGTQLRSDREIGIARVVTPGDERSCLAVDATHTPDTRAGHELRALR
jgi:hypothetical protein